MDTQELRQWAMLVALHAMVNDPNTKGSPKSIAGWAVQYADALIEADKPAEPAKLEVQS